MKKLLEQRNQFQKEMKDLVDVAEKEERAMSEEEVAKFEELEKKINALDATIAANEKARELENNTPEVAANKGESSKDPETSEKEVEKEEERAFASYIRSHLNQEERADVNLTESEHGAIIPKTIAKRIISKVKEISPLFEKASVFNVKGDLTFPEYDETDGGIRMAYQEEFQKISSTSGKFKPITLSNFLAGALTKIPRSLVNNTDFDLVEYVILKMAEAFRDFVEHEGLIGTQDKMQGALSCNQVVEAASTVAITADELIDLQMELPQIYQKDAIFIMNRNTAKAIRKLKNADGDYLFTKSLVEGFTYDVLGSPVYISENMPNIEAGKTPVLYIDATGLAYKLSSDLEIQVLKEKYADEHAIGVIGWAEIDSKIIEQQKMAALKMKAA